MKKLKTKNKETDKISLLESKLKELKNEKIKIEEEIAKTKIDLISESILPYTAGNTISYTLNSNTVNGVVEVTEKGVLIYPIKKDGSVSEKYRIIDDYKNFTKNVIQNN